jgi:glucose/arabinose dehydrogenase
MNNKFLMSINTAAALGGLATVLLLMFPYSSNFFLEPKSVPVLRDDRLAIELVAEGLDFPTSMHFLDDNTILVLEKNRGRVRVILDGELLEEPAMQLQVANGSEQGLLGITIWNEANDNTSVFLYLTESQGYQTENIVYKYVYDNSDRILKNKTLILDLPGQPGPFHNGGKIAIGPNDGYLYTVIGDVSSGGGMLDNQISGRPPNNKSVILRVDRNTGAPIEGNPFYNSSGDMEILQRYYAYGIRNSFGMAFDSVTGNLWVTENGEEVYDEINIAEPGFNSGWHKIMGPIGRSNVTAKNDLVLFDGAKYADPVFSWYVPAGVTDIEFFNSSELGERYNNNIFVGDINNGNLYFFEVNGERTGLMFHDPRLLDLVADPVKKGENSELSSLILGENFEGITDIETGPDGLLYILTYNDGKFYRITRIVS